MAALGLWGACRGIGREQIAVPWRRAARGSGTRGGAWVAELGFEHVHGLQEGGALAGGEAVEDPGQRGRGAVQPLLDDGPPGVADGDDGAAPVGRVRVPVDQARPVELGEDAAYRRQRQAERGGECADRERAAAQVLQGGDVARPEGRGEARRGAGTVAPGGAVTGQLVIDAASLSTGNKQRDKHLRSADFFDVARHPRVVLSVRRATLSDAGTLNAEGTFEAAGVAEPVSFTADIVDASPGRVTLRAQFTIDRSRFGMTWSPLRISSLQATGSVTATFTRSAAG